jgi:sugar/nucleoside kinase (ribokinase family)
VTPSIVRLGNLLIDDVVLADGTTRMGQPGGSLLYNALGATVWASRPGLVSVLGDDYPARALEQLQQRGVELTGVHSLGRSGVRTWVLYEGHVRRLIHRSGCPTHEEVSPRPEWRDLLADADAFFPSEDELLIEGADTNPHEVLPRLVSGRLRFVVFKRGEKGGIVYDAHHERFHTWDARVAALVDETGAGDAFAIGLVQAQLEGLPIEAGLQRAVVTASFALAGWGPEALFAATRADAEDRWRQWYGEGPQ